MFFLIYTLLLLLGGIAMVALGIAVKEQGTGSRILNVVVGLAMFAYGFYLFFLFEGGRYQIFFYVFVLPILLAVRAVKARKEAREQAAAHQFAGAPQPGMFAPSAPGQPAPGYPAPGYPAPGYPAPGQAGAPYGVAGQGHAAPPHGQPVAQHGPGPQGSPTAPQGSGPQGYPTA
ncbi:hypothetical protein ABZS44_26750 [Micromonospora sediminicola]|uniref:hypothetical protein n=1 Tax=Micromonospora sediminicola TaxID=946078 RepID=UPI0033AAC126